jgi:hypothetical protein
MAVLSLPVLLAVSLLAAGIAVVNRTWELDVIYGLILYAWLCPALFLWICTLAPLPCAVFAWHRSMGQTLSVGECIAFLARKRLRLFLVGFRLGVYYWSWFLFAGLPMFFLWPRTCFAPMVALFEDHRRVFYRSRRLLKEDMAVYVLSAIHACLFLALSLLIAVPRGLMYSELIQHPISVSLAEYVWVFELFCGVLLICGLSVNWCLSLTLLYSEIRHVREGELIRRHLEQLRAQFVRRPESVAEGAVL